MLFVDEFLWDCKETEDRKHRELTGVGNKKILDNLRNMHELGARSFKNVYYFLYSGIMIPFASLVNTFCTMSNHTRSE